MWLFYCFIITSYSNNIVLGDNADTITYPVQTPAVNFTLIYDTVSKSHTILYCYTEMLLFRLWLILEN